MRVDLYDILCQVVEEAWPFARERKNIITLSFSPSDQLFISGNATSLYEAFGSLVGNAIRHSDPCSEVILSCNRHNAFLEVSIVSQAPERSIDKLLSRISAMRSGWKIERRLQPGLKFEAVDAIVEQHGGYVTAARRGRWIVDVIVGLVSSQAVVTGGS